MDEDTTKRYKEQTEDLYAALGRFAVEFEHVCYYLRLIIMAILSKEGLSNEKVMHILLSDQTAEPLRALMMSLISETHKLSEIDKKIVNKIACRVQELTKKRNDVLHGTWFIGWAHDGDEDFTNAPGVKFKKNKKGAATMNINWKVKDFDNLISEAIEVWNLLARLNGCISFNFKIEDNFTINANGVSSINKAYE